MKSMNRIYECDIGLTLDNEIDEVIVKSKRRIVSAKDIYKFYFINKSYKNSSIREII